MAIVTQKITNYLGGVSKQPDDRKLPGQLTDIVNGYPDPTFGLTKRPGTQFIQSIGTGATLYEDAKWFFIQRDDDETYIGNIMSGSPSTINIWNAVSGVTCTVNYIGSAQDYLTETTPRLGYEILTVQDTSIITSTNTTVAAQATPSASSDTYATIRLNAASYSSEYYVKINDGTTDYELQAQHRTTPDYTTTGEAATDPYITRNADDLLGATDPPKAVLSAEEILTDIKAWLDGLSISGLTVIQLEGTLELKRTSGDFSLTVRGGQDNEDLTSIISTVDVISDLPATSVSGRTVAVSNTVAQDSTYWAEFEVDSGKVSEVSITAPGTGYSAGTEETTTTSGSGEGLAVTITVSGGAISTVTVSDPGSGYKVGDTVTVDNGTGGTLTITEAYGAGAWVETVSPLVSPGLDASTMPHELVNTALNTFDFQEIAYADRLVGDDTTNPQPTFVGSEITNAFFFNNRLGFTAGDNVIFSQAGEYYNFYVISALSTAPNDPIDLNTSSVRPSKLSAVLPTPQGVVLFADNEQFILFGDQGNLTPTTTAIRTLSNYEMDSDIPPVSAGTTIEFVSRTGGFSRVFSMLTQGENNPPVILDIGRVVANYIPDDVDQMVASAQNQLLCLADTESRLMYIYRTFSSGEKLEMQAWFSWQMPGNVQFVEIDQDRMWLVTQQENSNEYTLIRADLNQSPDESVILSSTGQLVNPAVDLYATADSVSYDAGTGDSKCYVPFELESGLTPVVVIGGAGLGGGIVESGFFTTPTTGTDGTGDYFLVSGLDLSTVASDVIVGYVYDMTLQFPRFYMNNQQGSDYTASLIVARAQFSLGQTGVAQFTVTSRGKDPYVYTEPTVYADYYLAGDVPLEEQRIITVPINERNFNFDIQLNSDSPFPVSLTSMMWEGRYNPRYYRRA